MGVLIVVVTSFTTISEIRMPNLENNDVYTLKIRFGFFYFGIEF